MCRKDFGPERNRRTGRYSVSYDMSERDSEKPGWFHQSFFAPGRTWLGKAGRRHADNNLLCLRDHTICHRVARRSKE
jgi:hypothetical protein